MRIRSSAPPLRMPPAARCVSLPSRYGLRLLGPQTFRTMLLALADRDAAVRLAVAQAIEAVGQSALLGSLQTRSRSQREAVVLCAQEVLVSPYPFPESLSRILRAIVDSERKPQVLL